MKRQCEYIFIGLMLILMIGCSNATNENSDTNTHIDSEESKSTNKDNLDKDEDFETVTLNLFNNRIEVKDNWDDLIVKPLQEKYPHITVNEVTGDLEELIAAGTSIDIYIQDHPNLGVLQEYDL